MIAGVLLAGGEGRRMGQPKGLVSMGVEYLVVSQLARLRAALVRDVRIVVGKNAPKYLEAIPELAPCLVDDPRCAHGPFGSLCAGIEALEPYVWDQLLVRPIDVPCCSPATIGLLRAVSASAAGPRLGGYGGHPVILARAFAEGLLRRDVATARLDYVLRELAMGERRDIQVGDAEVIADLNTPEDVARFEAGRGRG